MTISPETIAVLSDEDPDAGLIKNGRYQIVPEGSKDGKAKPLTRVTNYARELEDTFSLVQWQKRMVLLGAAGRSDITVAALANSDDNKKLNELAESAMDAAKANAARETGSALHRLCERVDQGEVMNLPEPWASDIAAYRACLGAEGVEIVPDYIEGVVVHPALGLAGRFDRIVRYGQGLAVLDLKTGSDLSYSWGSIAMQLAIYASARTIYDPATRTHSPMPIVAQDYGLVAHLPAGSGTCTLYAVDLAAGRAGLEIIKAVKDYRKKAKSLACPLNEVAPRDLAPVIEASMPIGEAVALTHLRGYVAQRVADCISDGNGAELAARWPFEVPTLKASDSHDEAALDQILAVVNRIESERRVEFRRYFDPRNVGRALEARTA